MTSPNRQLLNVESTAKAKRVPMLKYRPSFSAEALSLSLIVIKPTASTTTHHNKEEKLQGNDYAIQVGFHISWTTFLAPQLL